MCKMKLSSKGGGKIHGELIFAEKHLEIVSDKFRQSNNIMSGDGHVEVVMNRRRFRKECQKNCSREKYI